MKFNSVKKFLCSIRGVALVIVVLSLTITFVMAGIANAINDPVVGEIVPIPNDANAPIKTITGDQGSVMGLLKTSLGWLAVIFWIAAVGFIFYAAFLYLTAAGDTEKVKKASHSLLYGVIAIAVALMAYGLPLFIQNVLKGD